jgi:hypothetical protein
VPARIAPEAVVQLCLVFVLADAWADELPGERRPGDRLGAANDVLLKVLEVGFTARQQIWPGLSEQVLHAIRDEPCCDDRQGEAQETGVQLP